VGGNVSLYNEGASGPIYPTPVIGMVGRLPDVRRAGRLGFQREGEQIALVGPFIPVLQASELAKLRGEPLPDALATIEIEAVRGTQLAVADAVRAGAVSSAHDIAEGGLAVALAESCLAAGMGAEIDLGDDLLGETGSRGAPGRAAMPAPMSALFGEGAGGFLLSGPPDALLALGERAVVRPIGTVGGGALRIAASAPGAPAWQIDIALGELAEAYGALAVLFG
jgi:phosphoribosylformylglycinamidine synthase